MLFHIYFPKDELMMTDCTGIFLLVMTKIWVTVTPNKYTCQKVHLKKVFIICSTSFRAWPKPEYFCYFLWLYQQLQEIFVKNSKINKLNLQMWHTKLFYTKPHWCNTTKEKIPSNYYIWCNPKTLRVSPLPPFTAC